MALTPAEEQRLQDIEALLNQLKSLITGAASRNVVNRLLVLCNEEVRRAELRQDVIEASLEELITLTESLQ